MKIAHISDLHLDQKYRSEYYKKTIELFEYITSGSYDHIIISGDITDNTDPQAFKLARNLFRKFGVLDKRKLTVVPGNHDIYGGVQLAEDIINFPSKCIRTDYKLKLREFRFWFNELYDDNTSYPTPFIKEFDECVIIGLNSNAEYSYIKNPLASMGKIPASELQWLEKTLDKNYKKLRIVVTHHHFTNTPVINGNCNYLWTKIETHTMKLRKKKNVIRKFIDNDIKLILHGHLHESAEYIKKGLRFINAGGSVLGEISKCTVSFIEISGEIKTRIESFSSGTVYSNPLVRRFTPILFDEKGDPLTSTSHTFLN